MKKIPVTREQLISALRRDAIQGYGSRYVPHWITHHNPTRRQVIGLEKAGRRSSFSRTGYINLAEGVITEETLKAWPKKEGIYGTNLSYIGAKKILEILGAPISKAEIRKARKERREQAHNADVRRHERRANDLFNDLHKTLENLEKLGAISEKQLLELGDKFAALNLTPEEK